MLRSIIRLAILTVHLTRYTFAASIPSFVTEYAPLVYLDVNEPYLPSDIGAQIQNTVPDLNFTRIISVSTNLNLNNLSSLNQAGACSVGNFGQCPVYLTSTTNVTSNPPWLYGVLPDPVTGKTVGAKSCAVVVTDRGNNTLDAFYFYFYAYNLGENFLGTVLGNHVGDWEHTMVRFVGGKPDTMWYSAHDGGYTYTYSSLSKNNTRPIVYASLGGHANYPNPGRQSRQVGSLVLNDTTSAGPLWDPVANAYFYTFSANSSSPYGGTFTPVVDPLNSSSTTPPVDWLYFLGRWGDKQYPDSDPRQVNVANLAYAYGDGPTGPLDKKLQRNGTCPKDPCTTTSTLPVPSGNTTPTRTITRSQGPTSSTTTTSASPTSNSASSVKYSTAAVSLVGCWCWLLYMV